MDCQQAKQLFDAYLDGELGATLATELGAHRVHCAACRRALALLEVSGHILRADDEPRAVNHDFTDRLLACMDKPSRTIWHRVWRIGVLAGGTAAAAVIALAFLGAFDRAQRGVVAGERAIGHAPHPVSTMASSPLPAASIDDLLDDGGASGVPGSDSISDEMPEKAPLPHVPVGSGFIGRVLDYTAQQGLNALEESKAEATPDGSASSAVPAGDATIESESQSDGPTAADEPDETGADEEPATENGPVSAP